MGAWGLGNFENDAALDWIYGLEQSDSFSAVREALDAVSLSGEYIDADAGSMALAAAEVVAAMMDNPAATLPDEVFDWVSAHSSLDATPLLDQVSQVVSAIRSSPQSELRELWLETDEFEAWENLVDDLLQRLS